MHLSLSVSAQLIIQTCHHADPVLPVYVMHPLGFFSLFPTVEDARHSVNLPKTGPAPV